MNKVMYKLVSQQWTTHAGMEWKIGKTNKASMAGTEMCTNQVLHCYSDPRLAVLFNPIHANIHNPILLEIQCSTIVATDGLKHACKEQTPKRQLKLPLITTTQRVAFAIKCAMLVYKAAGFMKWAENWLSGKDRTRYAARAASAASYAASAAASDAASAASYAARAAASDAASAASYAARAAASDAASAAASAASYAASAAAGAAASAAASDAASAASAAASAKIGGTFVEILDWVLENVQ